MKHIKSLGINFRSIGIAAVILLLSIFAQAQSDSHSFLDISSSPDNSRGTKANVESAEQADVTRTSDHAKRVYKYMSLEFGTAELRFDIGGKDQISRGPVVALTGQVAYRLLSNKDYRNMYLSAGVEVRNILAMTTLKTTKLGQYKDYMNFVYAGIPLMFQYVNTKHTPNQPNDINLYFQVGVSVDYKVALFNYRKDNKDTWQDKGENYNPFMLSPFASAGISYTTKRKVCLLGPFVSYNGNDISKQTNTAAHFTSYGIRLSAIKLR